MGERGHTKGPWRISPNIFGKPALTFEMPAGTDMLLVCVDTMQHMPVAICLPHQLSVERAEELLKKHGANSLTVMPYKNAHKIEVTCAALSKATPTEEASDV